MKKKEGESNQKTDRRMDIKEMRMHDRIMRPDACEERENNVDDASQRRTTAIAQTRLAMAPSTVSYHNESPRIQSREKKRTVKKITPDKTAITDMMTSTMRTLFMAGSGQKLHSNVLSSRVNPFSQRVHKLPK